MARLGDEGEQVFLGLEEDDAAQYPFGLREQCDLRLGDDAEGAFAADEEIDRVHPFGDVVARGVLARLGHAVGREPRLDLAPAAERDADRCRRRPLRFRRGGDR